MGVVKLWEWKAAPPRKEPKPATKESTPAPSVKHAVAESQTAKKPSIEQANSPRPAKTTRTNNKQPTTASSSRPKLAQSKQTQAEQIPPKQHQTKQAQLKKTVSKQASSREIKPNQHSIAQAKRPARANQKVKNRTKKQSLPLPDLMSVFTELPESQADKNLTSDTQLSLDSVNTRPGRVKQPIAANAPPAAKRPIVETKNDKTVKRYQPPAAVKLGNVFPEISEEAADKNQSGETSLSLDEYIQRRDRNPNTKKPQAKATTPRRIVRQIPDTERPGSFDVGQPFTEMPESEADKIVQTEAETFFSKFRTPLRIVDGKHEQDPEIVDSTVKNWSNTPQARRTKLKLDQPVPPKRPKVYAKRNVAGKRPAKPAPINNLRTRKKQNAAPVAVAADEIKKIDTELNPINRKPVRLTTGIDEESAPIHSVANRLFPQNDDSETKDKESETTDKCAPPADKFPEELMPVKGITVDIAADTRNGKPDDVAICAFKDRIPNKDRNYDPRKSELCELQPDDYDFYNQPLYFEDANLERCGYSLGRIQPVVSAIHFFGTAPLIPYKMVVEPPDENVYSLGFCPPGRRYCYHRNYLPPWQWDAALVQAGVVVGGIYVIP